MGISSVLAVFALLSLAPTPAQAGLFKKIKKTAKKTTSTVLHEAEDIAERWVVSSASLPSFPPTVPYSSAALCSTGSLGLVPAVQPGLQARSLRNWQRSVQLKTRLTGTCAVWLPNVGVAAGSRTFLPQARFQIEETTGKVRPQLRVPLSDVTTTQIEVLSVFPVVLQPEAAQ